MATAKTKSTTTKSDSEPDSEPSEAVATSNQEHPIGVGVECSACGSETISTWPFEHCWKCGNRDWEKGGKK